MLPRAEDSSVSLETIVGSDIQGRPSGYDVAPPPFEPNLSFKLAYASLLALCLAVSLDATTLSVALPDMSSDLGATTMQAFWAGTAFLLASSAFQPVAASLSSIFGRNYVSSSSPPFRPLPVRYPVNQAKEKANLPSSSMLPPSSSP